MSGNLQHAVKYFNEKNYFSAQKIVSDILVRNENDPDAIYFLAVIKSKLGLFDEALNLFKKLLDNEKQDAGKKTEALYNAALCLQNLNRNDEALHYYKKALDENPFLAEAHNNIAIIYRSMNKLDEAEESYHKAIKVKPGNQNASANLATLKSVKNKSKEYKQAIDLFNARKFDESRKILLSLLSKNSEDVDALFSLGIVHFHINDLPESIKYFEKVIELENDNAVAWYSAGVCYQNLEVKDTALKYYLKAVELEPNYVDALNNIAILNAELKKIDIAEEYYKKALQVDPEYFNALSNLGGIKLNQDKFDEALQYFLKSEEVINKTKDHTKQAVAYCNLGHFYQKQNRIDEALNYFEKALQIDETNMLAHYNKAEAHLIRGEFLPGWKEYEWRTGRKDFGKRKFKKTIQNNDDLKDKTVLVYAEQGLGDAIQFVRYLPLLKEKGCRIIFECDKSIFGLLKKFTCIDHLIDRNPEKAPDIEYEFEIPLLSLPLYFNHSIDDIPVEKSYLSVDEQLESDWEKIIGGIDKFKIGIVWAGSPSHSNDRNRSVLLKSFHELFSLEGTQFFSLQKGFPVIQAKDYQLLLTILDDKINSFSDTAAAVMNLDLVITVDTSVAHVAGGLGKPVWVLLPFHPDWRWMLDREDSPWYPSMKLYRQPKIGEWDSVFNKLKRDLKTLIKEKSEIKMDTSQNHFQRFTSFLKKIESETYPEVISPGHLQITQNMLDGLFQRFSFNKDIKILDIGCGQGPALEYFKEKGFSPTGITLNDEDVRVCRSKGFDVYKMDQSFLEFEDDSFDLLWVRHCLEHSIAPYYTLSEFRRVLKPGGVIYIEVPAPETESHHELNPNHYSVLTKNGWGSLIRRSGFDIIDLIELRLTIPDYYLGYYCQAQQKEKVKTQPNTLYLGLTSGENFGWGICSKYLRKELSKKLEIINIEEQQDLLESKQINGKVFHALTNQNFNSLLPVRGEENYGYTFFESELTQQSVENAKKYDLVIGGSSWNKEKMLEKGITNTDVLIQGIDPELFYPDENVVRNDDLFIIFSGGKFELRKGQDIVLRAFKTLHEKYNNVILINAWYNMWPATMQTMNVSPHIKFEHKGDTWKNFMINLCLINGIDGDKVFTLPLTPNDKLRDIYLKTDVGLFPNRCEGGTNLVMMEYMACGKPVVASFNSGHKDILTDSNSMPLRAMKDFKLYEEEKNLIANWQEPDFDELMARLEYAYHHRDEVKTIGKNAGEFMKQFTWAKMAERLIKILW